MKCYFLDTTKRYSIPLTSRASTAQADPRTVGGWCFAPRDPAASTISTGSSSGGWGLTYNESSGYFNLSFGSSYPGATFIYIPEPGDSFVSNLVVPDQILACDSAPFGALSWVLVTDDLLPGFVAQPSPAGPPAPAAPSAIVLTATAGNALANLSWTLYPGADHYNLDRAHSFDGTGTITNVATGLTTLSTTDNGPLVNKSVYSYRVTAVKSGAAVSTSGWISVIPAAPAAPAVPFTEVTAQAGLSAAPRRQVMVTVSSRIIVTAGTLPAPVTIALTTDQKAALGLGTVTALKGLAVLTGAKLHSPASDPRLFDPALSCARVPFRLDDSGSITLYLCPGDPDVPGFLLAGTWHVWATFILSAYAW